VGAGSSGAVISARLSENTDFTVLLLEAGGPEPITSTIPFFHSVLPGSNLDWKFRTVPQHDILFGYENQVSRNYFLVILYTTFKNIYFFRSHSGQGIIRKDFI
jgi:glucose dehydrogenase (acceptor)